MQNHFILIKFSCCKYLQKGAGGYVRLCYQQETETKATL